MESHQLGRTTHLHDQATNRMRILEDERNMLESKVHKLESELNAIELSRDNLRKDKANVSTNYITFLTHFCRIPTIKFLVLPGSALAPVAPWCMNYLN